MSDKEKKIIVGVGAIILNDEGKIFLAKRGKGVSNGAGVWEAPGGGVEFGETMAEAIKREVKEEHGVNIEVFEMLNIVEDIVPEDGWHAIGPAFICRIVSGTPKIMEPDKCDEIGWFTWEEVQKLPLTAYSEKDLAGFRRRYPNGYPL